jgi:hypothetical protein
LILGPLIYMIGQALQPDIDRSEAATQLPVLVEHSGRGVAAMTLCVFGLLFFIPAALDLMRRLPGRGAWLGLIGGVFAIAGAALTGAMITAIGLVPFELAEAYDPQDAAVLPALQTLIDNAQGDGAIGAYIGIGFGLFPLGLLLLSIGLWRARAAPRWGAVVIAIGSLGYVAGVDHWVRAADAAILLAGMGAVGIQTLRGARVTAPAEGPADLTAVSPVNA